MRIFSTLALAVSLALLPSVAPAHETLFVGDLRQIAKNELKGSVDLSEIVAKPGAYGIGMLDGLDGELLILDGRAFLGHRTLHANSTLLNGDSRVAFGAFAFVQSWTAIPIPESVESFETLTAFIAEVLPSYGYRLDEAVPVRVQAKAVGLRWFIVGGMGNLEPSPRESFVRQIVRGGLDEVEFEAFGIHSQAHRGIYTSPGSDLHLHFRTKTPEPFVAHLDDKVILKPGGRLLIPNSGRSR
ncbi:MAG: acetolactate decarboxylase [Pseudomonadota bacterium]